MTADYKKIRDDNIGRYGLDTAVLDLLGQLYSERTPFICELIQNAEDAGATELGFDLFEDRLEVRHDGRPFTEADVRGVCRIGKSGKSGDLTKIGNSAWLQVRLYIYQRAANLRLAGMLPDREVRQAVPGRAAGQPGRVRLRDPVRPRCARLLRA
jgi:hypothetical protein